MRKVEDSDLIGTWRVYKIQLGNDVSYKNSANYSEWTFDKEGKAHYAYSQENVISTDNKERFWSIGEKLENDLIIQQIQIGDNYHEIVSIDKDFIALRSPNNGLIYHYVSDLKWYEVIGKNE